MSHFPPTIYYLPYSHPQNRIKWTSRDSGNVTEVHDTVGLLSVGDGVKVKEALSSWAGSWSDASWCSEGTHCTLTLSFIAGVLISKCLFWVAGCLWYSSCWVFWISSLTDYVNLRSFLVPPYIIPTTPRGLNRQERTHSTLCCPNVEPVA